MCYNARGPKYVRERAQRLTDPAVLDSYGGPNYFPLYYGEFAATVTTLSRTRSPFGTEYVAIRSR